MTEENGMETYDVDEKPDYITGFIMIMAVMLLLFGWGFQSFILGTVGVMCFILVALKFLWKRVVK